MGNFCGKSTETTLHEICAQVFLRFSGSSKSSQSVLFSHELVWLSWIGQSEENLLKTSCKFAPVTKVAHIFWWRHDNRKTLASAREHWCDISCDIPYRFKISNAPPCQLSSLKLLRMKVTVKSESISPSYWPLCHLEEICQKTHTHAHTKLISKL